MHNVQWFTLKFLTHYEPSPFRLWFPFLWSICPCWFILVLHLQHQSIHKYSIQEWTFSSHDPTTIKMTLLKEEDPILFLSNFSLNYQSPKFHCENYCYLNKRKKMLEIFLMNSKHTQHSWSSTSEFPTKVKRCGASYFNLLKYIYSLGMLSHIPQLETHAIKTLSRNIKHTFC